MLNGNADGVGLYLNAGNSNATYAFTGPWTGSGAFKFASGEINHNVTPIFHFKGDMTGYEGDIISDSGITVQFGYGDTGAGTGSVSGTGTINGTRTEAAHAVKLIYDYTSNVTAANTIIGNVALTKKGYADLTLTGANTYTGSTTIEDGTLVLTGAGSTGTGNVVIGANAALRTDKFGIANSEGATATLTVDSNGLKASSIGTESVALAGSGVHTITGNIQTNTLTNAGTLRLDNAGLAFWCGTADKDYNLGAVDVKGSSSITSIWANANVNIAALSSEGPAELTLCNNTSGTNTHNFNLGTAGKADSTAAFTGTINLAAGPAYTTAGRKTTTDLVIKEENVAANAVINFSSTSARANNLNLKVGADEANVAGITTDSSLHEGEVPVITSVSGTKTLGLTGGGNYEAHVTLNNIKLDKTGSGTQTFTGDASGVQKINVEGGELAFKDAGTLACSEGMTVSGDGALTFGNKDADYVMLTAKEEGLPATISGGVVFNSASELAESEDRISGSGTISNAHIAVNSATNKNITPTVVLNNTSITSTGAGSISMSIQAGSTLDVVEVRNEMTIIEETGSIVQVKKLDLSKGQMFSAYSHATLQDAAHEIKIVLDELSLQGDAHVNANLVFGDSEHKSYKLNMQGTLSMGSDLYLYYGGVLEIPDYNADSYVLFTGVDNLYINDKLIGCNGNVLASSLFTNTDVLPNLAGITFSKEADGWTVGYTARIPEPATATLSLLALAALAARRRRRK